jgi:dynein heavy chain 2
MRYKDQFRLVVEKLILKLAMGQGQSDTLEDLILQSRESGRWVCLKNVHLALGWLSWLEKSFDKPPHPKFRLILTSNPHLKFPRSLLRRSIKWMMEAPPGIKRNLERSFELWDASLLKSCRFSNRIFYIFLYPTFLH